MKRVFAASTVELAEDLPQIDLPSSYDSIWSGGFDRLSWQEAKLSATQLTANLGSSLTRVISLVQSSTASELQNLAEAVKTLSQVEWPQSTMPTLPVTLRLIEPKASTETIQPKGYTSAGSTYLLSRFTVRGEKEGILALLNANPVLEPLLFDTYRELLAYFHKDELALEVATDLDSSGDAPLLLSILVTGGADEAYETLDHFDRNWWLKNIKRAKGKLIIDVELR